MGYNSFFEINNKYIEASGNFFYSLGIYIAIAMIIIATNIIGYNFLLQRKLFKYITVFTICLFIMLLYFAAIADIEIFIEYFYYNLKTILLMSVSSSIIFNFYVITIFFSQDINIKISRLSILISKKQEKIEKLNCKIENKRKLNKKLLLYRIKLISKEINKLNLRMDKLVIQKNGDNKEINNEKNENNKKNKKNKSGIKPYVIYIFIIAIILIGVNYVGYYSASQNKTIKIVAKEFVDENYFDDCEYAVIYENDKILLICPCEENEGKKLKIYSNIQIEIDKKKIFTKSKTYKKISCYKIL